MTPANDPENYLFQQVRDILGKENSGMDFAEVIAWLRRLQIQLNNLTTNHTQTIQNLILSSEDAQTGVQATNNRINALLSQLGDITERLNAQAAAIRHLNSAREQMTETPLEWLKRKAGELCQIFSLKLWR